MPYPTQPDGYLPAIQFVYPKIILNLAAILLMVTTIPILLVISWLLRGLPPDFLRLNHIWELPLIIVVLIATITVHELVHGLTYQWLGYRVSYGVSWHLFAAYAAAFGQFQTRNHNLLTALTPLFGLTMLLMPLLAVSHPTIALLGFLAILFNISGSVGDIYLAWRLLNLPSKTLMYDQDVTTMLIYIPKT
ncbi:DUF3267 domain-containing protein [Anaerolineales bacterium HSG6]|nr:DUF3267 domain-containing protein [Anaerolineales bacterium HSG6]MDM8531630.1 DUF3267 domain-containing protein [Anaerolineales bacterium HSG25]